MLAVVYDGSLKQLGKNKVKTRAEEGADEIADRIIDTIHGAAQDAGVDVREITGVCVTVPGVIDRKTGTIRQTPNLPFRDFPIKERLSKALDVEIMLENDVSAGTYGEYRAGAAQGYDHVIGVFPGTGIGGGLILNGQLYAGATGNAGEIGHMIIQTGGPLCGCGQHGCLEALAGKTAMAKDAVYLAGSGAAPSTLARTGTDFAQFSSKVFAKAFEDGEESVMSVVRRAGWFLGIGLANCVNIFSPEAIVIGGGLVEKLRDHLIEPAVASMRTHAMDYLVEDVRVFPAQLGDSAVVIGAAALVQEASE